MKREGVELVDRAISFQDFRLCGPDPPTSQTDRRGRTDDVQSQYRALHYIVHRAVKR